MAPILPILMLHLAKKGVYSVSGGMGLPLAVREVKLHDVMVKKKFPEREEMEF